MKYKMKWMKWSHKFSSGPSASEWIEVFEDPDSIKEMVEEFERKCDWSDHYRGIEYELFDAPPIEILQKEIEQSKIRATNILAKVKRLEKLLVSLNKG